MNRIYEALFILKPDAPEEEADHFIEQMKTVVTNTGGAVDKVDKWGKRKLAYRVEKYREGSYVLLQFTADAQAVKEFERRLRVADVVIKFITVRIDEKMKKIEKRKKAREKRASRRPAPQIAAPAAPAAPPAPAMPAEAATATVAPGLPGARAESARPEAAHAEPKAEPKE